MNQHMRIHYLNIHLLGEIRVKFACSVNRRLFLPGDVGVGVVGLIGAPVTALQT